MKVSVGISNRHIHLKKEDADILFGKDYEFTKQKDLNQPGQFSCMETVDLKTEKGEIKRVRIIGPIRDYTQIEISKTDSFKLGLNPPVRTSGDVEGSCGVTIVGPKGVMRVEYGVIIADRHIHVTKDDLKKYGFSEDEVVNVSVGGQKGAILKNVHLKLSEQSYFELHLDTDDANALLLKNGDIVDIL